MSEENPLEQLLAMARSAAVMERDEFRETWRPITQAEWDLTQQQLRACGEFRRVVMKALEALNSSLRLEAR
jgi:hypothetical protein